MGLLADRFRDSSRLTPIHDKPSQIAPRDVISFLTDDIIRMRYVEINGQLRKVLVIIKMRGSNHSKDIREYVITDKGLVLVDPRDTGYAKLTTGSPDVISRPEESSPEPKATRATKKK